MVHDQGNGCAQEANHHLRSFVKSFVLKERRDRWEHLLCNRPRSAGKNSHKLYDALDRRWCKQLIEEPTVAGGVTGVFYNFFSEPMMTSFDEAWAEGLGHDAVFSVKPGRLAFFFFHEDEVWICSR